MELFGLLFAFPVTLVISAVFCSLALRTFRRFPWLQMPAAMAGGIVLGSVALEVILSFTLGPVALHQRFEVVHWTVHMVNFVLVAPSVACVSLVVALRVGARPLPLRVAPVCLCWFACMATLVGNIAVSEAIEWHDGSGVPAARSL